jgi:hypothetical protein
VWLCISCCDQRLLDLGMKHASTGIRLGESFGPGFHLVMVMVLALVLVRHSLILPPPLADVVAPEAKTEEDPTSTRRAAASGRAHVPLLFTCSSDPLATVQVPREGTLAPRLHTCEVFGLGLPASRSRYHRSDTLRNLPQHLTGAFPVFTPDYQRELCHRGKLSKD